jgi:hypothetical protein
VTGQSHNPAKGRRLARINSIFIGENLPQHNHTSKFSYFKEYVVNKSPHIGYFLLS